MGLRRSHPSSRESQIYRDHVVASLERGGFDRKTTLILGGGALALMGMRPAKDVDIMVPGATFNLFERRRLTPGGLIVQPKSYTARPIPSGLYYQRVSRF